MTYERRGGTSLLVWGGLKQVATQGKPRLPTCSTVAPNDSKCFTASIRDMVTPAQTNTA